MDFPHINDTKFPIIDNVNVYKYQNNFDYARWEGKVSFKLLNVLWNSNYADVPFFETDVERDNWFNEKDGYVGVLETLFNNTPTNVIKIPIPYNEAYKYNYLVVDMPLQTSIDNPINYEDANNRVNRWFYFIEDMTQFSPNTTELQISVDYWTTFIHSVEIPYLMLERGHAPMMQTSVDEYLQNPILNNEYLLADDFNYGSETVIQTSNYFPIGNGKKYVLFCAPYSRSDFDLFDGTKYNGNSTPPTYSNTNERWGYQIQVNDYEWKYGDVDYSNSKLPIHNMINNGLLNGCECFAIEGQYAREFFNDCAHNCVHFIHGIQAMFILDESLFVRSSSFNFRGYTLYIADRKINNVEINLTKELFGFDEKYREITKLYTFPYSSLEVTDDNGNTFSARIENCGNLKMHEEVSLMYPFLNYNVFFSGINGSGEMKYKWVNIQDGSYTDTDCTMWADDFSKFMMNWEVPVYSIYVSSEYEYAANNFFNNKAKRAGAIKDYENSVRYANTTRENIADTMQTNTNNTQRTTTKDVQNVANVQSGLISNMIDTNDANDTITDDLMCGDGTLTPLSDGFLPKTAWANWEKLADDGDTDWKFLEDGFNANADYFIGMSVNNGVASIVGGSASETAGILSAGSKASPTATALPIVGGLASSIATAISIPLTITRDQALTNLQQGVIDHKLDHASTNIIKNLSAQVEYNKAVKDTNNDLRESITERFSDVNGINNVNENRDKVCNDTNAIATQTTETANATYDRNASVTAAKADLVQKQLEVENQYKNARLHVPVKYSDYSGTFSQDALKRRGVRFNIRTQSKSVIAQTGDAMLRFGYALHRVWDMKNGFHYGKHFTFWKAEDIWINDGNGVANTATNTIGQILMKGVTVWKNPDEIGMIGIYDNI